MAGAGSMTLQEMFVHFAKFGDTKADGRTITLSQSDKWMKQANIIGKKITTTDTGIAFNKFKARTINLADYEKFLEDLAKSKKMSKDEIVSKMVGCGLPGTTNTTATVQTGGVARLTDAAGYTGTHKERFDKETGKGRGREGREDVTDNTGYVSGYKEKETYDKTHK